MNITIVGGGNIGTQFAVHCAAKKHNVTIYTSKPSLFEKHLYIVDEKDVVLKEGIIHAATFDALQAFSEADLIFVTMPAYCMEDISKKIFPFIRPGAKIGLIPGTGGGECAFKPLIDKGCCVFGIQRVPSVARLIQYGQKVCAMGYRKELFLASLPQIEAENCCGLMMELFDMPCTALPCYLNVTLTPSNPILHTTRLRILFRDYYKGKTYDKVPLFYEEWDDLSSELVLKCDDEVQQICHALRMFDLSYIKPLKIHYESDTKEQLTHKLQSIESLKRLTAPVVLTEGKYIPDLSSRYFTADFPFGLSIIKQIADLAEVSTPNIDETLKWYVNLSSDQNGFSYKNYGIRGFNDFEKFYSR